MDFIEDQAIQDDEEEESDDSGHQKRKHKNQEKEYYGKGEMPERRNILNLKEFEKR